MQNLLSSSNSLDIDLSFIAFPVEDLNTSFDNDTSDLMKSSRQWHQEIGNWIIFIKENKEFQCPEIVRNTSKLSLGLELTNDKTISELNQTWLGEAKSTDVLSFPIIDQTFIAGGSEVIELGDIVISVPTAIRQAKENNVDLFRELRWLASHGLLHLLGWEHCDEESLVQMLSTQEQLLDLRAIL